MELCLKSSWAFSPTTLIRSLFQSYIVLTMRNLLVILSLDLFMISSGNNQFLCQDCSFILNGDFFSNSFIILLVRLCTALTLLLSYFSLAQAESQLQCGATRRFGCSETSLLSHSRFFQLLQEGVPYTLHYC